MAKPEDASQITEIVLDDVALNNLDLIKARDLAVELVGAVVSALNEPDTPAVDGEITASPAENERVRLANALLSVGAFFGKFCPLLFEEIVVQPRPEWPSDGAFVPGSGYPVSPQPSDRKVAVMLDLQIERRFVELGSAIRDLNSGNVHKVLRRTKSKGHQFDPTELWVMRARVVIGYEARLQATDEPVAEVAKKVEREFPSLEKLIRPQKTDLVLRVALSKTLKYWRKHFSAGKVKSDEAVTVYEVGREEIKKLAKDDLADFALRQFRAAVQYCGSLSPS
jgi:hypothetical protein